MATQLMPSLVQQFLDANGVPLANGLVQTYAAGTTTPQATYTDQSGGTPNANPITLDSNGCAQIWLSNLAYKFVVMDLNSNAIRTIDNVSWINPGTVINSMLANMAQATFKGRAAGSGTGSPIDMSATQATAALNPFVGDSGSGGTQGVVPAPSVGYGAAKYNLTGDGVWTPRNYANIKTTTLPYTALGTDQTIYITGSAGTLTLPDASANSGQILEIVHRGSNFVKYTISSVSAQAIGGYGTSASASTTYETWILRATAGSWQVLEHFTETGWVSDTTANVQWWIVTCSSANATLGATYTDSNSNTFVVAGTIAAGTTLYLGGYKLSPAASGTLTKTGGTGDATITYSSVTGALNPISTANSPAPTMYAVPAINVAKWKRNKNWARFWLTFWQQVSGGGGAGSGDMVWALPTNMQVDLLAINTISSFVAGTAQQSPLPNNSNAQYFGANASGYSSSDSAFWEAKFAAPHDAQGKTFRVYGDHMTSGGVYLFSGFSGSAVAGGTYTCGGATFIAQASGSAPIYFFGSAAPGGQTGTLTAVSGGGGNLTSFTSWTGPAKAVSPGSVFMPATTITLYNFWVDFPISGWLA